MSIFSKATLLRTKMPEHDAKGPKLLNVLTAWDLTLLGVGLGWIREEYEALGVSWKDRGRLLDEQIDLRNERRGACLGSAREHHPDGLLVVERQPS